MLKIFIALGFFLVLILLSIKCLANSKASNLLVEEGIVDKLATYFCYGLLISFALFLAITPILFTIFNIMNILEIDKKRENEK